MTLNGGGMGGGGGLSQSGDQAQAFIDCILLYAKNLEADAVSVELQVRFEITTPI